MTTFAQRAFSGGEIAPALWARCDTVKYSTGARTLRNMLVPRHGGAASRSGTQYIATSLLGQVRLIPFVFNASQTYVLEVAGGASGYIRFYKNGVQLTDISANFSSITNANPGVFTTSAAHGFTTGDEVQISGILGPMGQYLNNRNFTVQVISSTTFSLRYLSVGAVDTTAFGAYASGGTAARVYTLASPYTAVDIAGIKFVQSADVMTFVHPNYLPQELKRLSDTSWTLTPITLAPTLSAPTGLTGTGGPLAGGITLSYKITAVSPNGDESFAASLPGAWNSAQMPTASNPATVSWSAVSGAQSYNVYRSAGGGGYGYLANTTGLSYSDIGAASNAGDTPPYDTNLFATSSDYPSAVAYIQQRLTFANSAKNPETCWLSRTGRYKNFTVSTPTRDDDSITFRLVGRQVNSIKHIVDIGKMIVLTSGGEWAINGDASGVITPTGINAKQYSYNGASDVRPIVIDNSLLYVQARGSFVRDLTYDFQVDGYRGNDLTVFSSHLVQGHTIKDWTYCQIPDSIVWAVRDDGILLGLTYVREQQILAWHRHDTDGVVESVCSVPEGDEDVLYLSVIRKVNGSQIRHIERMGSRTFTDILNYNGLDDSLVYDGRNNIGQIVNLGAPTLTLSGGTSWDQNDTLTATASSAVFSSSDIGNACFVDLYDPSGNGVKLDTIRCTITGYTSSTVVSVVPHKTVPASLRNSARGTWSKAIKQVVGLWHLEGKTVGVFADRFVVGNPNNDSYPTYTVTNGSITLDAPYAYIRVGLPKICDIETLDIDTPQGTSLADKKMAISKVTCFVQDSRSFWAGSNAPDDDSVDPLQDLTELKIRDAESMNDAVALVTDKVDINIASDWNSNGRVFIRHIDPLPLTILEIAPAGLVPIGRG